MEEEKELAYVTMSVHYRVDNHKACFEISGDVETLGAIAVVVRDSFMSSLMEDLSVSPTKPRKAPKER